ncbi:hypothetical protein [Ferruginibacter profundus]
MKKLFLAFLFLVILFYGQAQTLQLSISNPQPRIGDEFELTLDIKTLKSEIFKSIADKVQIVSEYIAGESGEMKIKVKALKKGINELGPLTLSLNGVAYTTNTISYEVIDPLPNVDRGLWFRKVKKSDSTFCIIIEQRIPANEKTTYKGENSISIATEPETKEFVKFKERYSIAGLSSDASSTSTDFSSVKINGQSKSYMRCFSVYNFAIDDKTLKIIITKDLFDNLPKTYKFEEIYVQ